MGPKLNLVLDSFMCILFYTINTYKEIMKSDLMKQIKKELK